MANPLAPELIPPVTDRLLIIEESLLLLQNSVQSILSALAPSSTGAPSVTPAPTTTSSISSSGLPSSSSFAISPLPCGLAPTVSASDSLLSSLPHPRQTARDKKLVRTELNKLGFFPPVFELSKRDDKKELKDLAAPHKAQVTTLCEIAYLLGPAPDVSNVDAYRRHSFVSSSITHALSTAVEALLLIEAKRSAPNLSVDQAKTIILSKWPSFTDIKIEFLTQNARFLQNSLLLRAAQRT